jgi:acyl dehydratase/NAD(P)-dependent dehydrogenase (short-subunit alcohol dehydrogenase family)
MLPVNMTLYSSRLQTRIFDWKAQADFAFFSGDRNPWHMDAIAARRTQAGRPVVHGMHAVLWALEVLASDNALHESLAQINVDFNRFIYVGEEVALDVTRRNGEGIKLKLRVNGLVVTSLKLTFGRAKPAIPRENLSGPADLHSWTEMPAELSLDQMGQSNDFLPYAQSLVEAANFFPGVAAAIDSRRVAALACVSRQVGMVCPGLHSIFNGFTVTTVDLAAQPDTMHFQVTKVDERLRLVSQSVEGGGWSGRIESFARIPPVAQASVKDLADFVRNNEFKHTSALIVGGSRGLGELTAKLIAAGGGAVTITYAVGRTDALDIQRQIHEWGGMCEILHYDVTKPAEDQLHALKLFPTSVYYFATPVISRRKIALYSRSVLNDFMRFYVDGFYNLLQELSKSSDAILTAFYPSSVAVEERPAEMSEYAMAKAAGEVLCANLARFSMVLRVVVVRLPRMLTDQTATLIPIETAESRDVILPIIRRMEIAK